MMVMMTTMSQSKSSVNVKNTVAEVNPVFHDFLGMSCASDSPVPVTRVPKTAVPEASPSYSGGARGPASTTSDLGSEKNHLEGVPFYGPRSDLSGPEISNRFSGCKRSNSDSAFMGSSRDGFPHTGPGSLESSHLMKMIRSGAGGDRPRRSNDDELLFGMQSVRPSSASLVLQPPSGARTDANFVKWDRSAGPNISPAVQYPSRVGQLASFVHQVPSNRFRDANVSSSIISQSAADEGSRTGIKGSGILASTNTSCGVSQKNPSAVPTNGSSSNTGTHASEPESSTPPSRHGLTSVSRQMTIFYGGQAHVFDDVHPNKADVIMALAGSNGSSWSTNYSPKPTVKPGSESYIPNGENDMGMGSNMMYSREFRGRLSVPNNSSHGVGPVDRISKPPGGHQGSIITKDARNPVQAAEASMEEKR